MWPYQNSKGLSWQWNIFFLLYDYVNRVYSVASREEEPITCIYFDYNVYKQTMAGHVSLRQWKELHW